MYRTVVTICTAQWSLYVPPVVAICTASLTFSNSTFCLHSVFVWIWEQTAIISLYNINWLLCITETECVYCAVRTGSLYRVSQEECSRLREGVPYVKVYRYNPKHLCPKLNGYGEVWSSCGSTYCTWFAWRNTHTLRIVRPCLQPAQARSPLRLHM